MWIITRDGVAVNCDHVSKLYYRHPATMAKVAGMTTVITDGNAIGPIMRAMKLGQAVMDLKDGDNHE